MELNKTVAMLHGAYPFFNDDNAVTYYGFLKKSGLPEEVISMAVQQLIATSPKLPAISEIIAKAKAIIASAQGKHELSAGEAWQKFYDACIHADYFRKTRVHFAEAALERTATMFTVEEIRFASDKDLEWKRRSFLAEYERQRGTAVQEAENAALISRNPQLQALLSGCLKLGGGK